MTRHRVQVSVFLEPEVHKAAKQRAGEMKLSLSATVAEAAKESLLSSYRSERENQILKAEERNFFAVRRLEQRLRIDLQVVKELIGLGMRSFFNHTPPFPDNGKTAALPTRCEESRIWWVRRHTLSRAGRSLPRSTSSCSSHG